MISCIMVLLAGCTQTLTNPNIGYRGSCTFLSQLPFFSVSYGKTAFEFNSAGIYVQAPAYYDSSQHFVELRLSNDTCTMTIRMKRDAFTLGQYQIDGTNGSVSLVKFGRSEIGRTLPSSYFIFVVTEIKQEKLAGYYSGALWNPSDGSQVPISGAFNNINSH